MAMRTIVWAPSLRGRLRQALGELPPGVAQGGRIEHLERFAERRHPHEEVPTPGAAARDHRRVLAVGLDRRPPRRDAPAQAAGGGVDAHAPGRAVLARDPLTGALQAPADVGRRVAARDRAVAPAPGRAQSPADAVDPERAPVLALEVPGEQVPARAAVDDRRGLGMALARALVARAV